LRIWAKSAKINSAKKVLVSFLSVDAGEHFFHPQTISSFKVPKITTGHVFGTGSK